MFDTLESQVRGYHAGQFGMQDAVISNEGYMNGASYAATDTGAMTGRASLGILSIAIVGLMFFYISTRGRQF